MTLSLADSGTETASSYVRLANDYFIAGYYCLCGAEKKEVKLDFSSPVYFLFSHSIELSLKAWLLQAGDKPKTLKSIGHNLVRLYLECIKKGLVLNFEEILSSYSAHVQDIHLEDSGNVVSEMDRLRALDAPVWKKEVCRHFRLVNKLHGSESGYLLRYMKTGRFALPNLKLTMSMSQILLGAVWKRVIQSPRFNK